LGELESPVQVFPVCEGDMMKAQDFVLKFFEKIAGTYGKGEEKTAGDPDRHYFRMVALNPCTDGVGLQGAIGFLRSGENTKFALWSHVPQKIGIGTIANQPPLMLICAGPRDQGMWASGYGERMRYEVRVEFPQARTYGLSLDYIGIPFLGVLLMQAWALMEKVDLEKPYWEADHNQDKNYTKLPRIR